MTKRNNPNLPAIGTAAYSITVGGVGDAGIWLTTFDYLMSSAVQTASSEFNVANSFDTTNTTTLAACLASTYTITSIKVSCLTNVNRIPYTKVKSVAGSVAGSALPSFVASKILKQTGTKGQHGRGRNLLPGVPVSFTTPATNQEQLNATGLTALGNLTTTLIGAGVVDGAITGDLAIITRAVSGQPSTLGQTVSTISTVALLSSVRRRRVGVGK